MLIQVYFIDYGNTELVDASSLVTLPASLTSQTGFALESSLCNVRPANNDTWSSAAIDAFSDIAMADSVQVVVVGDTSKVPLSVKLSSDGVSVSQKLIDS